MIQQKLSNRENQITVVLLSIARIYKFNIKRGFVLEEAIVSEGYLLIYFFTVLIRLPNSKRIVIGNNIKNKINK